MADFPMERSSDSPFVHRLEWGYADSKGARAFVADSRWYLFVQKHHGKARVGLSGPMTKALRVPHPSDVECVGIRFGLGVFLPTLSRASLVDDVIFLPEASSNSFWLHGSAWEIPTFENAESFVDRLVREGLLVHEPVIGSVVCNQPAAMSSSTVRRRFLRTTGLTPGTVRQIERVRAAEALLRRGKPILDVVHEIGFFDQPHLTRSMKRFLGVTPAQITSGRRPT